MKAIQIGVAVAAIAAGVIWVVVSTEDQVTLEGQQPTDNAIAAIALPETLSANAEIGMAVFEAKCAACHGVNAVGQLEVAPPLVHVIYEPSHHGDEAFQRAVANGVRGHHWPFGNMSPVEGLTRGDVKMIIAYIRELQRANGIN